jgi:hypothetical protein
MAHSLDNLRDRLSGKGLQNYRISTRYTIVWMRQLLSLVAGLAMFADTVLPIFASDHIAWLRWRLPIILCAVLALVALIGYAILSYREEKREEARWEERDKQQGATNRELQEANTKLTSLLEQVTRGDRPNPSQEPIEEPIAASTLIILPAHEQLRIAEEAVFVDEALKMPSEQLKIDIGHDPEFRRRFEAVPKGKFPEFDDRRYSISREPIIAAKFMRAHLMPWSPFSGMVKDLFKSMGKTAYETRADFLFQIYLVNVSDNVTTIQQITTEAEVGGKWVKLPRLDDLSNYELVTFQNKEDAVGPFARDRGRVEELTSLWDKIKEKPLERGIGFEGWVGFELEALSTEFDKPINHKVRLVDALGGIHSVVTLKDTPEPEPYGEIRHSQKMYDRN